MTSYNMFINNRNISIEDLKDLFSETKQFNIDSLHLFLLADYKTQIGGPMSKAPFRICGIYEPHYFSSKQELYNLLNKYDLAYNFVFENNLNTYFTLFTQNQPYISRGYKIDLPEDIRGSAIFQVLDLKNMKKILDFVDKTGVSYVLGGSLFKFQEYDILITNPEQNIIFKPLNFIFQNIDFDFLDPDPIIDYYISYVKKLNRTNLYKDELCFR